jgi:hypothetical protein
LEIEAEADFLVRRSDLLKAEGGEEDAQNESQPAFAGRQVGGEIPAEEDEKKKAEAKGKDR